MQVDMASVEATKPDTHHATVPEMTLRIRVHVPYLYTHSR
jgi:hypothetical protein